MENAPYFSDVADGPAGAQTLWVHTRDWVRLRIGVFAGGHKGTVLLFPGRTEYVEKYGPAARELLARGYSSVVIDWRGQGLSDRVASDPIIGHVAHFTDFQHDVAALLAAMPALDLPRPWHLLGHSMGGAIALRAVIEGLQVNSVVFTAPMWGIRIQPILRPIAWLLGITSRRLGLSERITPFTYPESYVLRAPFADNMLTTDETMYRFLQTQLSAHPELALGGPSLSWLYEALQEVRWLRDQPAPDLPAITFLGSNERIVDPAPIVARMANWPGGRVEMVAGAEHEVLMESAATQARIFDTLAAHFHAADLPSNP